MTHPSLLAKIYTGADAALGVNPHVPPPSEIINPRSLPQAPFGKTKAPEIDGSCLVCAHPHTPTLLEPLTACQIHQVQLAHLRQLC